ncbi:MAG: hypothetical protein KF732_12370 [Flavobacteriales bacterium]|nr:hypothetical protein [Flavobacteriales bacterium]MBX2960737.1 hypothetical protein [Flavobacteriales bacterium]
MLKRLFILNTDDSRPWIKIILWWEFRRILYNFLLIVFGIFALTILSFIVKDLWSFFSPPIFFLMWTGLFLFLANVFYTSGWIFQLITRNSSNKFINRIRPKVFIYGLLLSFGIELIPSILTGGYTLVTGERIKSQYADFATEEPNINDIVGDYVVADISKRQLNLPDSISLKTVIKFNADKTFEFKYFPHHEFGMNLSDYELVNAKGKWKIEKDQGSWVIPMDFDTITTIRTGHIDDKGYFDSNAFHINKDKPPYEIYIMVGDPDSWEGVTLQKR